MVSTVDLKKFFNLHEDCECVMREHLEETVEHAKISKDNCDIKVESLVVALDCDSCDSFTSTDRRPDIISIRRCNKKHEWLILEMKRRMREHAAKQALAALEKLGSDSFFSLDLDDARIFFVIKNKRRADTIIMRKIKMIEAGRWKVIPRLIESGETILCK